MVETNFFCLSFVLWDSGLSYGFSRYRYLWFLNLWVQTFIFLWDYMGIDIYVSFGSYQCGHWYYSFSIFNILSFLLFKKGCLRMSSILKICWSYSIQAWQVTSNYHRTWLYSFEPHSLTNLPRPVVAGAVSKGSSPWFLLEKIENPRLRPARLSVNPRSSNNYHLNVRRVQDPPYACLQAFETRRTSL